MRTFAFVSTLLIFAQSAAGQSPPANRAVSDITFGGTQGSVTVITSWVVETSASGSHDLGTDLALFVNGTQVGFSQTTATTTVTTPCPVVCHPLQCDLWIIDGVNSLGTCAQKFSPIAYCACQCSVESPFVGLGLVPGDSIQVVLSPSPGTDPETYTADDSLTVTFTGLPSAIPTMSEWAMIVMAAMLACAGALLLSRRLPRSQPRLAQGP